MKYNTDKINIVFICSSLEPGRDGVGDYCRRLAAQLIIQGHLCSILSIHDRYINSTIINNQYLDDVMIPVMRLPAGSSKGDIAKAKTWLDELNPQWLSLQFVTFGYHPKGLTFGLSKKLRFLASGRRWHIMFHELWVGMAKEESAKLHWWGRIQKYLIKQLIIKLKPQVIHTQTKLYQQLLHHMGFIAGYLPLFSNIPVNGASRKEKDTDMRLVVFGTIHSGAPINVFTQAAARYSVQNDIPVKLIFIGNCGPEQQRWAAIWEQHNMPVEILGSQPAEKISEVLSGATMGISATALAVIEKSGSVAAMREHGLPVISLSKPWHPVEAPMPATPQGVIIYQDNFEECLAFKFHSLIDNTVSEVSVKFAAALNALKVN
jgi:hypothetical protein